MEELNIILDAIGKHLKREKVFVQNPARVKEVARSLEIAKTLFPDHKTEIEDDPLQAGALILSIECTDSIDSLIVRGEREIELFNEMTAAMDNFEIYEIDGHIRFAAVFNGAFKLIK